MVVLHTLGESTIRISSKVPSATSARHAILTPTAGTLFTLAAYLISQRGTYVSRAHLASLLWPADAGTPAVRQRLRSAIAKLRERGINVLSRGTRNYTISIAKEDAVVDEEWLDRDPIDRLLARDFTVLPHYEPVGSPQLHHWFDSFCDQIRRKTVTVLTHHLDHAKFCGDWALMATIADRLLELNPYNGRAKQAAQYARNILATRTIPVEARTTSHSTHLTDALSITSSDQTPIVRTPERPTHDTQLVGRRSDMALLSSLLNALHRNAGKGVYLWGERGIGKSRLMRELEAIARADEAVVVSVRARPHDRLRPLSVISELVPRLNALPGAAGASAAMRDILRHFLDQQHWSPTPSGTLPSEPQELQLRTALLDLLDAVTEEQPIVLIAEDFHWADPASATILIDIAAWANAHPMLAILTSRTPWSDEEPVLPLHVHQLLALEDDDATQHALDYLAMLDANTAQNTEDAFFAWCVRVANGNPQTLEEILLHSVATEQRYKVPPSVSAAIRSHIHRLPDVAQLVLSACALNQGTCSLSLLMDVLQLTPQTLLPAMQTLAQHRLITSHDDATHSLIVTRHDAIDAVVLQWMAPVVKTFLRERLQDLAPEQALPTST